MNALLSLVLFLRGDFRGAFEEATGSKSHLYVTKPQEIGTLLDDLKVPRWIQRLMFEHRIVKVIRTSAGGATTELPSVGSGTPLRQNDHVEINSSHPPYVDTLARYAREAKDYVFVAEFDAEDHFVKPARQLMERRKAVTFDHIDTGPELSLQQFVQQIGQGVQNRPPNDLHIISHAWHTGELLFAVTATEDAAVTWEALDAAGETLRVPDSYLEPRINNPPKLVVHACEFGRARPVLEKLRQVMNVRLKAYAPKHFIGANSLTRDHVFEDYFEYMCKPCWVHSQVELTREEIINDLLARGMTDANDKIITLARWKELVPPITSGPESDTEGSFETQKIGFRMPARNVPGGVAAAFNGSFEIGGMYRYPVPVRVNVKTSATRAQFNADPVGTLKTALAAIDDPRSKLHRSHPYPTWRRAQFATLNELIDGIDWVIKGSLNYLDGMGKIEGKGWSVKYCVLVPVQAPAADSVPHRQRLLRVSYYADGASTAHPDELALTSGLWESTP